MNFRLIEKYGELKDLTQNKLFSLEYKNSKAC